MNVDHIEHHLQVFSEAGEYVAHYGNSDIAFVAPRVGEHISFIRKKRTFEVTRVIHEFIEYETDFHIGYVTTVYGKEVTFEDHRDS